MTVNESGFLLKPCPFCGSHATLFRRGDRRPAWRDSLNNWTPRCGNRKCIGYTIRLYFDTKQKAIDAWNRRAIDVLMEDDGK